MFLSTKIWKKYRDFTINKLKNATVDWNPYWHVVVEETLHPELLHLCNTEWPNFKTITAGTRTQPQGFNQNRSIFIPESGNILFWNEYYNNIMCHANIQKTIYTFDELNYENKRWVTSSLWEDYRGYSVSNHYDGHTIDLAWQTYLFCDGGEHWVTSSLWEDYRGYSVSNHYDGHTIDLAWQTYLFCDGGEHWGTCLNDKDGNMLKKIPNIPNLSWVMRVDSYSWHGCEPIECDLRQSIMVRYMYKFASKL